MNRQIVIVTYVAAFAFVLADCVSAQTAGQLRRDRLRGTLDVQDARISEQRVQRQTEVMRLESMIRAYGDRMNRLERQMLTMSSLPGITIHEAEAGLEFAKIQLAESEKLHGEGNLSDVTLAAHRLELARAEGQLESAKVAHADRLIALEIDVLYAERKLVEYTQEQRQMERLVAKGYSTSEGLKWRSYDVSMAKKQLELAQLRLAAQRKAAGDQRPEELLGSEFIQQESPEEGN